MQKQIHLQHLSNSFTFTSYYSFCLSKLFLQNFEYLFLFISFKFQHCIISNCGEYAPGEDFGLRENDGTEDVYTPFPEDSDINFKEVFVSNH